MLPALLVIVQSTSNADGPMSTGKDRSPIGAPLPCCLSKDQSKTRKTIHVRSCALPCHRRRRRPWQTQIE
jgi:hypothetical protein